MFALDFERPILELEAKLRELQEMSTGEKVDFSDEIRKLEKKIAKLQADTLARLTPWQRCQIARHPNRPFTMDYIKAFMTDFVEIHGDRGFADDKAMIAGLVRLNGIPVVVVGQQKGRDTKEKIARNFAMAHPEGYRKALRAMKLGEKFGKPVVCLVDTPGAYPGLGAEERGQAEAIARNLREMAELRVPILVAVTGEGGSGGALGISVGDSILMLEYAIYSVISPEGCASILWRSTAKAPEAAEALGLTAQTLKRLELIDEIVPEPVGGAHRSPAEMAETLREALTRELQRLRQIPIEDLLEQRYRKFRRMGVFEEA
ncbi:MAG: acetyl-CoA carboxylase carboxyltransferase subunit alpha [candidate division NC10 bacterium]|nr:acetyl-CoA carboxylase carboxyltransferase subunit alpha [candidate division NC10 bacterium]MBI4412924.1 acetyl-CoA carboxylase carboxyltransferase subunit alpha [candidate division NC10 bacterium]